MCGLELMWLNPANSVNVFPFHMGKIIKFSILTTSLVPNFEQIRTYDPKLCVTLVKVYGPMI